MFAKGVNSQKPAKSGDNVQERNKFLQQKNQQTRLVMKSEVTLLSLLIIISTKNLSANLINVQLLQ